MPRTVSQRTPALSVVIPVHNEEGNIGSLLTETCAELRGVCNFEIVCVDDGSQDQSLVLLRQMQQQIPELRVLSHVRRSGQSAALCTGVRAARADWVATLDGDGQNDPADVPRLLLARRAVGPQVKLLAGWRVVRYDSWSKRVASRIANAVRMHLLGDATPDSGCGIKLFERASFIELPTFSHMHRYLPALFQGFGHLTTSVPVVHRQRRSGRSNYSNLGRLGVAFADLFGVAWLLRRRCLVGSSELAQPTSPVTARETSAFTAVSAPVRTPTQAARA